MAVPMDDAYRITYSDIMWVEDGKANEERDFKVCDITIYNTLEKTVKAAITKMK